MHGVKTAVQLLSYYETTRNNKKVLPKSVRVFLG